MWWLESTDHNDPREAAELKFAATEAAILFAGGPGELEVSPRTVPSEEQAVRRVGYDPCHLGGMAHNVSVQLSSTASRHLSMSIAEAVVWEQKLRVDMVPQ